MSWAIRFENDDGSVNEVGMNNLILIQDRRIKTRHGLLNRMHDIITMHHPYKTNRVYRVYRMSTIRGTWTFMFKAKNAQIISYTE